jgi:hypothetical protein
MSRTLARLAGVATAGIAVAVASCGGPHIPVALPETGATLEGTVKYGSEEIQFAMIMVQSPAGTAFGSIGDDGRYRLVNVPLGEVQVAVNTAAARGDFQSAVMAAGAMTGGPEGKSGRKRVNVKFIDVPPKYYDPATSGLGTTVSKGVITYDIVIPK